MATQRPRFPERCCPLLVAHNALERTIERGLVTRYPDHRRLIGVLGWIERISFGVGTACVLSIEHHRQAQINGQDPRTSVKSVG